MKHFCTFFTVLLLAAMALAAQTQEQKKPVKTAWELKQEARDEISWKKEQIKMHADAVKKLQRPPRDEQLADYLWGVNDPRVTRKNDSLVLVVLPVSEAELSSWTGSANKTAPASNDPRKMLWVSLDPELSFIIKDEPLMDSASVAVCIKQLTGRAPQVDYPYIVSFWVSPKQLFRPTPDPDPTTHFSTAFYPDNVSPDHKAWMEAYKEKAYELTPPHAWTRLGYTCDWGNVQNPVGVSEFVVKPGAPIRVESLATTWLWYSQQMPVGLLDPEIIYQAPPEE